MILSGHSHSILPISILWGLHGNGTRCRNISFRLRRSQKNYMGGVRWKWFQTLHHKFITIYEITLFSISTPSPKKLAFEIWTPKYSTREVLVAENKLFHWPNYIRITKDSTYKWKLLKINGQDTTHYKRQRNWQIMVVCIPLSAFEIVADE